MKNNGEVREKAEIRKNYQEGAVSADWEFEPYDVVDDEGRVVEENIPENGILVKAAVTLRCESSECISERYFRVMPKELDEEHKMIREIENYLKKQSADPESYNAVTEYTEDTEVSDASFSSTGKDENAIFVSNGANVTLEI